jgi:predicted transcriptional regulator
MKTIEDIKTAIARLEPPARSLLIAELFANEAMPDEAALEAALQRGISDVKAGRVRPIEEVKALIPRWASKS